MSVQREISTRVAARYLDTIQDVSTSKVGAVDGGPVEGTGGGQFGAPRRWTRHDGVKRDAIVWATDIPVGRIGEAARGASNRRLH